MDGTAVPVVLIHGVGFGPDSMATVARTLEAFAPVVVLARRGYGARAVLAPAPSIDEHVADVIAVLDSVGASRAVVAGVSGGATIALALALAHPQRLVAAIAHEPAVGSLAPDLLEAIGAALATGGGAGLCRALAGEDTWDGLTAETVQGLADSDALIRADAAAFVAFEPALGEPSTPQPLVCTVGARSGALRRRVAHTLSRRTGAPLVTIAGCAHLPQYDAPETFATLIRNVHTRRI